MSSNTVSIIVSAFRAERWLQQCIESIQAQRLPKGWSLEILLGIDGCLRTADAARSLDPARLRVFFLPENRGTYVTCNTLMSRATGERIDRFDSDDVMRPEYLYRQIESTDRVDLSFTWSIYTDEYLRPTSHVMAHEVYHPDKGEHRRPSDGHFMMRRRVRDALGGFRPWRCAADTEFLQRAKASGFSTAVVEEFLFYRRTHPDSLTVRPETNFQSDLRRGYQAFIDERRGSRPGKTGARVEPVIAMAREIPDLSASGNDARP